MKKLYRNPVGKKPQKTFHQCAETVIKIKILSLILENIASLRKIQASAEPAILTGSCKCNYNFPSFSEWYGTKERKASRQ